MENCESYDEEEEESTNETNSSEDSNSTTRIIRRRLGKAEIVPELPYARGDYGNALC